MMVETGLSRSIRLMFIGSLAFGMHVANAQTTGQNIQKVEVTGSSIKRAEAETISVIQTLTRKDIEQTGKASIADVVRSISADNNGSISGSFTNGFAGSASGVSLRGLSVSSTLVLINGRRTAPYGFGDDGQRSFVDLNSIPLDAVDRIDILKDGASAIYGSDAIAGVVNIILKKSMNGGKISLYRGINEKGDGKNSDYDISYGSGDEKASLMFSLSHTSSGVVWAKDRDITATSASKYPTEGLGASQWGRIQRVAADGKAFTDTKSSNYINSILNHTGTWQNPAGVGADSRNKANYHTYTGSVDDQFNTTTQMMFQSPTELTTMFTKGEIQLPWDLRFKSTAMFSERTANRQNGGYPLNSLTQAKYPVYVDKNSYYNPYGASATGGAGEDLFFYRRMVEMPRITESKNQTVHIDATVEGDFTLAGKPWSWSAGYNHSAVTGQSNSTGNINLVNLKKALGPSFLNASGVVQCGTPAAPIGLAECLPFDILGGPSASNAAVLKYLGTNGKATYGSTVNSATADINGELFSLPAGAVGFAAGAEYRQVRGYDYPDQFAAANLTTDLAYNGTSGRYDVKEFYAEANVPLLKDKPFAKLLSVDVASRHSDYSNFGTTTNSKISFMWKPVDDLLTRGTWAQGFRAPSLNDTFGGGSQTYDSYVDVCDSLLGITSNATVATNCRNAGVPTNFRQKNASGDPIKSATQTPIPFSSGAGNADLKPETAKTKTLGLVYSPSFVPGFTASVDWFNITVNNRITAVSVSYTLNECYLNGNPLFCKNVVRDASGQIVSLTRGNTNLGTLQTEGVDIGLNYRLPRTPYGQFNVRSESTWLKSYRSKSSDTANWNEYAGDYGVNRLKSNLSVDWSLGNWSSTVTMRYSSAVRDKCRSSKADNILECSNPTGNSAGYGPYNKIGSVTYTDLNVGYSTPWKGKIAVGANNLFDKAPRTTYSGDSSGAAVDPNLPIDRFVYVRYTQSF